MTEPTRETTWVEQVFGVSAQDPELIHHIRRGCTPQRAIRVRDDLGVTKSKFADWLGVHARTLQRAELDGKPLSLSATDRLYRICELLDHLTPRAGGRDAVRALLREPLKRLDGATPADLMDTSPGLAKVKKLL